MTNPKVGLLFLVPGHPHSLRVNGTARLLTDDELCKRLTMQGKPARAVLEVTASEVFFHSGKSLMRSRVWEPSHWPDRTGPANLGAVLADQINMIDLATAESMVAESIALVLTQRRPFHRTHKRLEGERWAGPPLAVNR